MKRITQLLSLGMIASALLCGCTNDEKQRPKFMGVQIGSSVSNLVNATFKCKSEHFVSDDYKFTPKDDPFKALGYELSASCGTIYLVQAEVAIFKDYEAEEKAISSRLNEVLDVLRQMYDKPLTETGSHCWNLEFDDGTVLTLQRLQKNRAVLISVTMVNPSLVKRTCDEAEEREFIEVEPGVVMGKLESFMGVKFGDSVHHDQNYYESSDQKNLYYIRNQPADFMGEDGKRAYYAVRTIREKIYMYQIDFPHYCGEALVKDLLCILEKKYCTRPKEIEPGCFSIDFYRMEDIHNSDAPMLSARIVVGRNSFGNIYLAARNVTLLNALKEFDVEESKREEKSKIESAVRQL